MDEKILLIAEKKGDIALLKKTLGTQGFDIETTSLPDRTESRILEDQYAAIIADYDLIENTLFSWVSLLQENRARSCFILYGDKVNAETIAEILQKGAYSFVPRTLLSERIYDTLLEGLENRKAYIEILAIIDKQRVANERLEKEKEALRTRNQELGFINRLSTEVAYDLNWDRILPRILGAGLLNVIDPKILGILYRIGPGWNLALHLSAEEIDEETLQALQDEICKKFVGLSSEAISKKDITLCLYPSTVKTSRLAAPVTLSNQLSMPLSLAGKPLGMLIIIPDKRDLLKKGKKELISTISNILAMSLKNAQEYHLLKEMAVTDGLTGIYNHKGLTDFMQREFLRATRYEKPLSLIMIDVNDFKVINDSFGHLAGDYVLQELAKCLKHSVRNTDIVGRYGGDEFAILLPEAEIEKAQILMKRILHTIENHPFKWGHENIKVMVSYGIATAHELDKDDDEKAIMQRADSRLYASKQDNPLSYAVSKEA